jgi:hypothetical protein
VSARWLTLAVLPLHYGVPQRCGAAIYGADSSLALNAQTVEQAVRPRRFYPAEGGATQMNSALMQALENVTTAGIYAIEYAQRTGSRIRGSDEFE